MKIVTDLHIHSRYARACSKDLTPPNLALWAKKKGIHVLGTGDFTHPKWFEELSDQLVEDKPELYALKTQLSTQVKGLSSADASLGSWPWFMLTTEVSSIYKQGDKVRRVHNLIFAPSLEAVAKFNQALEKRGVNIRSDGRPIMGITCSDLVKICKDVDPAMEVIPAHAWTPHFGVFGSLSGFDSLEEAFGDQAKYIFAIETGLSSDPKMNWQVAALDKISLISNSDAHSLSKLGREANVFEIDEKKLSYSEIIRAIKQRNPKEFLYTIEFFPEEGKYHLDGHRDHKFSCLPEETNKQKGLCPICGKKLLMGVLHRVADLANRPYGATPSGRVPFKSIIPLQEIIAETFGVGAASKKVAAAYENLVTKKSEFEILLDTPADELIAIAGAEIGGSILKVREGQVEIIPGYDGLFGTIHIK